MAELTVPSAMAKGKGGAEEKGGSEAKEGVDLSKMLTPAWLSEADAQVSFD